MVQTDLARYIVGGIGAEDTRLSETTAPPTGVAKALKEGVLDKMVLPVAQGANTQVFLAAAADNAAGEVSKRTDSIYWADSRPVKPSEAAAQPSQVSPPSVVITEPPFAPAPGMASAAPAASAADP